MNETLDFFDTGHVSISHEGLLTSAGDCHKFNVKGERWSGIVN
jgi:hypothetical protein